MYESAFGLQKRPFAATPDPACVFTTPPVQDVLEALTLCLDESQGVAVLTGTAGTGKTLLCRKLILELCGQYTVAYLGSASFASRRAMLQAILYEIGQQYAGLSEQELRLELKSFLRQLASQGQAMILIVDEAHLLNERLLEELRLLANTVEAGRSPVRILLAGQLVLEETLASPALSAVGQIISCQHCLEPLTRSQSLEYIAHRIRWAGGDSRRILSDEALEVIARASGGLPRCLNQLADHSLLLAFVHESQRVERSHVEDALADLKQLPLHWNEPLSSSLTPQTFELDADDDTPEPVSVDMPLSEAYSIEIGGDDPPPARDEYEGPAPVAGSAHILDHFADQEFVPGLADSEAVVSSLPRFDSCPAETMGEPIAGWPSAGGIVPLSAGSRRTVHLIEEEVVFDRYAQIDAGVGLSWPSPAPATTRAIPHPEAAASSELLPEEDEIRIQPEMILESHVLPLLEETLSLEDEVQEPVAQPDVDPLVETLESEVFDICLDVQQSILDQLPSISSGSVDGHGDLPVFDAVEPELPLEIEPEQPVRIQHIDTPATRETTVPRPNYKLIFSTLRKKLGKK